MNIAIVGTGYVGLVSGTCFAEMGVHVTCVDVNREKIENLQNGRIPIYEPGLDEMVMRNFREGRLSFTTHLTSVLNDVDIVFCAVGTPPMKTEVPIYDMYWQWQNNLVRIFRNIPCLSPNQQFL